jgi:biopolymer transport protein ExbB
VNIELDQMHPLVQEAVAIWLSGGWGMIALAFNGVVMYAMGVFILLKLGSKGMFASPDRAWKHWQKNPRKARGTLGRIIRGATACKSLVEIGHCFEGIRNDEVRPFDRDLKVMMVSVTAAPLLGLLGTVTGMLATFHALSTGGGGDKTMGMVAGGISEALVTTETGLVLALSGLIFQFILTRQHENFEKKVTHLETLCTQEIRRRGASLAMAA